jgi:hypothetical protein
LGEQSGFFIFDMNEQHGTVGEFIQLCAESTNDWLNNQDKAGKLKEQRGLVCTVLASGETIVLRRMGVAQGSIVKIEGEKNDGTSCLLLADYHSIQIVTFLVPRMPGEPKREIGFHTGLAGSGDRTIVT